MKKSGYQVIVRGEKRTWLGRTLARACPVAGMRAIINGRKKGATYKKKQAEGN